MSSIKSTIIVLGGLGAVSALIASGVTADHKNLPISTPSSSAIAARFATFDSAAFDTRGAINHKPLKVAKQLEEHTIGGLRSKMRQESPQGQAGAEWQ
ncbi:hypothetical protein LTR85_004151 [Meristemomyces frigidus]|nr:hypothetical protein LTR85_004151 [Meristemomyces frigidus]